MDLREAYRILGISETDSETMRKRKYRRLMLLYHPDAAGDENIHRSQRINAAYEYVKTHSKELSFGEAAPRWNAAVNENAFCDREVFVDYSFLDKRIPIRQVAEGKYLWDPYLEDFKMLARSVAMRTADLIREYACHGDEAGLFHLLMQDFIEPISCARKVGLCQEAGEESEVYAFAGAVGVSDFGLVRALQGREQSFEVFARPEGSRVAISDREGVIYGNLSYDEDSFYYVVNPLLLEDIDGVKAKLWTGELHTARRDLNCAGKLDISIQIEIGAAVSGSVSDHYEEIQKLLEWW
ncbi:MAG: J domain-containing protein [Lachnospiraceae bacterium]|nr:J domain-containing protein [Lachnospiraceae bacterium]